MYPVKNIAILGSGNVGRYFLENLKRKKLVVAGYARRPVNGFEPLEAYHQQTGSFDLTLLCVNDDAIADLSAALPSVPGILAHVSGVSDLDILDSRHPYRAVFYPLMSIRSEAPPAIQAIPFCIESHDASVELALIDLVHQLGARSHQLNSAQRQYLHLAAVVSQNFSNFLIGKAKEILDTQGVDYRILLPLLQQSLERLKFSDPREVQTGPAVRGDTASMHKHLEMISSGDLLKIYQLLSENIQKDHDKKL